VTPFAPADFAGLVGPHPSRTAALYGFAALLMLSGALFAFEYFNDLPRTPSEIEDVVGAPILGTVQRFNSGRVLRSWSRPAARDRRWRSHIG
jgi:capsular polysaccharide biosynthesis protein